jgi:predicted nucleic acid-binding protein
MADIILDANVVVAVLDAHDVHATRARELVARLHGEGHVAVLLDLLVAEALSVLARRSTERKTNRPDFDAVTERITAWHRTNRIRPVGADASRRFDEVVSVVRATRGVLNFNDALLVVLQQSGAIGDVATFDEGFAVVPDFRRVK